MMVFVFTRGSGRVDGKIELVRAVRLAHAALRALAALAARRGAAEVGVRGVGRGGVRAAVGEVLEGGVARREPREDGDAVGLRRLVEAGERELEAYGGSRRRRQETRRQRRAIAREMSSRLPEFASRDEHRSKNRPEREKKDSGEDRCRRARLGRGRASWPTKPRRARARDDDGGTLVKAWAMSPPRGLRRSWTPTTRLTTVGACDASHVPRRKDEMTAACAPRAWRARPATCVQEKSS